MQNTHNMKFIILTVFKAQLTCIKFFHSIVSPSHYFQNILITPSRKSGTIKQ